MKNNEQAIVGVWLLMLLGVFLIAGCASGNKQMAGSDLSINENSTTEEIQQHIDSAVAKGDANTCLKIQNKMPMCLWRSSCLARVAEHNRDEKICKKISPCEDAGEFDVSDFAQEHCRSDVERAKLKDTAAAGPDACMKLDEEKKNICLSNAALNKADYTICELIVSEAETRDTCLFNTINDSISENKVLCDKIKSTVMKENCQKVFAIG